MTGIALAAPPLVGERQTSTHDCGPAALASNLQWAGRTDTEPDVVDWMVAHGLDNGATSPQGLFAYLQNHGVPAEWDFGNVPMGTYVPAALARGHLVIGLHQCNGDAEPVPVGESHVAHWRIFYADDMSVYRTMNPWEPELETLYQVRFDAADLKTHIEIYLPVKAAPTPPQEHDPRMFTIINFQPSIYVVYDDHVMIPVDTPADVAQLETLPQCHGTRTLNPAMLAAFLAVAPK